jgi:hypothetical protein
VNLTWGYQTSTGDEPGGYPWIVFDTSSRKVVRRYASQRQAMAYVGIK